MTSALMVNGGWPKSDHKKGGCVNLVLTKGGIKNPNNVVDIICELPLRAKIVFRPGDRLSGGVERRERGRVPWPSLHFSLFDYL